LGKVLERVLDLLEAPACVAGQHVDETEGVLHALVVVVLGQEAHLAGFGQLRHFEGQLLLQLLDMRAQLRLDILSAEQAILLVERSGQGIMLKRSE